MMRGFRRAILCMLLAVLLVQLPVCAQSTSGDTIEELSIRINNPGARISAKICGTPNTWVTIELIRPGSEIAEAYGEKDMLEVFAGFDMLEIPASGELTYLYMAEEQTGMFTLRVRGEVSSVSYTGEGNVLKGNSPDAYFTDMWTSSSGKIYSDYMQGSVWLTGDLLNKGVEFAAKKIKKQMDTHEPGRRLLSLDAELYSMPKTKGSNFIWEWSAVEESAAVMDEFFRVYYEMGGELDGVYTDNEITMCPWGLTDSGKIKGDELQAKLDKITADPTYINVIRPRLLARGFRFDLTPEQNELTVVSSTDSSSATNKEYVIWTAVLDGYKNECLTAAFYEPAKKYFPDVAYANYWSNDTHASYYIGNAHRYHLGGNRIKAGTHSSPVLYSAQSQTKFMPDGSTYTVPLTPFGETLYLVNGLRTVMLSTDEGKTMPWVVSKQYGFASIDDDREYFYEYMMHLGLCNPDAFLLYGPNDHTVDTREDIQANIDAMKLALIELNTYADKTDAKTLIDDFVPIDSPYILSGMHTKGRFLWRITPDKSIMEDGQEFCTKQSGTPTFSISGTTITFPEGTILENISSSRGYWVETPEGVYPNVTAAAASESMTLELMLYDEHGIVLSDEADKSKADAAVILLKNAQGQDVTMSMAKYLEGRMTEFQSKSKSKLADSAGQLFIDDIKPDASGEFSKLFIWDSFKAMRPIKETETLGNSQSGE